MAPSHVVRRSAIAPRRGPIRWVVRHHWVQAIGLVAVGVVGGWALPRLDAHANITFADTFDEATAQVTLAAIAGGMITLTGFVFTAVTLVIQTVQAQSPRLLRAIDGVDRTPIVFGLFAGTFTFALIVLSGIRPNKVPVISVYVALLLVLLCVGAFFRLLVTLRSRLTSGGLVRTIGNELRISFDKLYPMEGTEMVDAPEHGERRTTAVLQHEGAPGVFESFDEVGLVRWAVAQDAVVSFDPVVGDFVATGSLVATVATSSDVELRPLSRLVHIGPVRTLDQDPAYGLRLLVDVALRALSPAINDPTTAVQTIDQLDDLLHRLSYRPLGNGEIVDATAVVRVRYPAPSWETLVSLSLDEIRIAGSASLQVVRRLRALLVDLAADAPAPRKAPVEARLRALDEEAARFSNPLDRRHASQPDRQGIGRAAAPHISDGGSADTTLTR
ncbi:MAG: DUF2254 domain-containing protein [Acidimicrobiales bacterium]